MKPRGGFGKMHGEKRFGRGAGFQGSERKQIHSNFCGGECPKRLWKRRICSRTWWPRKLKDVQHASKKSPGRNDMEKVREELPRRPKSLCLSQVAKGIPTKVKGSHTWFEKNQMDIWEKGVTEDFQRVVGEEIKSGVQTMKRIVQGGASYREVKPNGWTGKKGRIHKKRTAEKIDPLVAWIDRKRREEIGQKENRSSVPVLSKDAD